MEKQVTVEELRKRKLFVATPMYGGACAGMFCKSMNELSVLCAQYGIELRSFYLFNESLITRARNYCVDEFMRSGFSHMMFIDSDIGFDPNDVIALLALADDESEYDVICGPYAKKCISWEKIKYAVDKGVADENPNVLEQFVGDYVFNPVFENGATQGQIKLNEPTEVLEAGTGFMMIRRATFEKYDVAYPHQSYLPDHVRSANFDGSREIMAYFDCIIDPKSKRYLSEDYMFCQNVRNMGGKVFLCPWMNLHHVGSYIFGGSLTNMLQLGASPTADENVKRR
jgi:glycosyltransferase involved in cell wall biosynthesis